VDHVVHDLEEVTLRGITLVTHLTRVQERGKTYDVVFVGGTSINPGVRFLKNPTYPSIADDYARTFRILRSLKCDVFLGAHGGYYRMAEVDLRV
jgi:metallo-beta-lactamase class B